MFLVLVLWVWILALTALLRHMYVQLGQHLVTFSIFHFQTSIFYLGLLLIFPWDLSHICTYILLFLCTFNRSLMCAKQHMTATSTTWTGRMASMFGQTRDGTLCSSSKGNWNHHRWLQGKSWPSLLVNREWPVCASVCVVRVCAHERLCIALSIRKLYILTCICMNNKVFGLNCIIIVVILIFIITALVLHV